MSRWLATSCRPDVAEEGESISAPPHWPSIRPELCVLFPLDMRCVALYECHFRQEDGSHGHHVQARYLPHSDLELTDSAIERLADQLCAAVRDRLQGLDTLETKACDEDESTTRWSPADNSYIVEAWIWGYLPTISVTELDSEEPDFFSLIEESPLKELASLTGDCWIVDHVACGRSAGDFPRIHIQARNASPQLFQRLVDLGYEERQRVWWKERIAIQPLSGDAWGAVVPAPSFIPGARR